MQTGDRVHRKEDREDTAATVVEATADAVLIDYDEGGQGWWPHDCLEPIE